MKRLFCLYLDFTFVEGGLFCPFSFPLFLFIYFFSLISMTAIITQVNEKSTSFNEKKSKHHLPHSLDLSLRGTKMKIDRDTLLMLPESILIVMFPQGFALDGKDEENNTFCNVDFSVEYLHYMLDYVQKAKLDFKKANHEFAEDAYISHAIATGTPLNPLLTKQAIIVLREELEYFVVVKEKSGIMLHNLKRKSGDLLVRKDLVFDALLKNIDKDNSNNVAEYHLVDMLCTAGFSKNDHWQQRSVEPNKTCVSSLSLVTLCRKDRVHIGQKLMMFWRKPARKCWWTKDQLNIDGQNANLWCRRTWTLELILV